MSQALLDVLITACVLEGVSICFVVFAWLYASVWKKGHLGAVRVVLLVGLLLYSSLRIVYWNFRYAQFSEPTTGMWHAVTDVVERIEWLLILQILLVLLYFWSSAVHEELDLSSRRVCCFNLVLMTTAIAAVSFCVASAAW
jgi:uncharacterized membrane protein